MHTHLHSIDPVTVELHVEIPWERFKSRLEEEYARLQREARIKGFRPGKVPRKVIEQLFSKALKAQVASKLVDETVVEAVERHNLPIVSRPMLQKEPELRDGDGLSYRVRFEVRPLIESIDTSLELVREVIEITDTDIASEIERLRHLHAVLEAVQEPRPVRAGDIVEIEGTIRTTSEPFVEKQLENLRIDTQDPRVVDELREAMIGMEVGQKGQVEFTASEELSDSQIAGRKVSLEFSVKGIWVRRLPEVDDEFAKDVGDYESLEALRQAIKAQLEEEAKRRSDERLRNDAVEQFVQKNPIPLPPSLVEREMANSLANQRQIVKLLGASEKIVDENKENTRKQIEKEVRAAILFLELATRKGISVSEEEIDRALAELAAKQGKPLAKIKAEYSGEKRERFQQKLLYNKLIDFLISQARIVEKRIPESTT